MNESFKNKSTVNEIRDRFDNDVDRFSDLDTGQQATIDAPLAMELITQAAATHNSEAKYLLDIGCGAGNNTLKLLQQINPLHCDLVDISKPMLERAKQRIDRVNKGKTTIIQTDFREAELQAGRYDIVIAAAVLHHLRDEPDWKDAFQKIYKLTAPGGSVWITDLVTHENTRVQQMMWDRYGDYLESIDGPEYRKKVFSYIEKEDSPRPLTFQLELLRKVGFKQVDILHKNSCFAAFGAVKEQT